MTYWKNRLGRKETGGRIKKKTDKKSYDRGTRFLETKIGDLTLKVKRARGGNVKVKLKKINYVNVSTGGKTEKLKIWKL